MEAAKGCEKCGFDMNEGFSHNCLLILKSKTDKLSEEAEEVKRKLSKQMIAEKKNIKENKCNKILFNIET